MLKQQNKDGYESSRFLYIIEAALEYFVAISVGTVYLAKITGYCGISDEITAILTAFVSLGCGFQFFSVFIGRNMPVKKFVTAGHIVSQVLFTLLYVVPLIGVPSAVKTVAIIVILFSAQVIHNLVNAPKTNWFMSMVKPDTRGRFTAIKEIVSLIGGTAFSFALSYVIDRYESEGNLRTAFILGAVILGTLTIAHTLTLVFSKKPPEIRAASAEANCNKGGTGRLLKNKTLLKLVVVSTLWIVANYATASFSGTYMNNELGFSLTFSSAIVLIGSLCRVIFSIPFGKFADKKGFCPMLVTCFAIAATGYALNVFTVPENGKILYPVYYSLYCIAMAGINSSMINLVYDYVAPEDRAGALAINQSVSGIAGFLITLLLSPVMSAVKKNGNTVFGIPVYSQQLFSLVSLLIVCASIVYLLLVVRKLPHVKEQNAAISSENTDQSLS